MSRKVGQASDYPANEWHFGPMQKSYRLCENSLEREP
jgi:hypothetical protein